MTYRVRIVNIRATERGLACPEFLEWLHQRLVPASREKAHDHELRHHRTYA